nr:MAG TPA: hypothetical protein [Caudoviricetes sp.]
MPRFSSSSLIFIKFNFLLLAKRLIKLKVVAI